MDRHVYVTNYGGVWFGVFMGTGGTTSSWILLMEVFYQGIGVNVDQGFPAIVCLGVPFPPDKVLELIVPPS